MLFRNFYRCARCSLEWEDVWSKMCDDDCPECNARHMSPYKSEDVQDDRDDDA
jgi:DNA-directed RNA polymerase subunit RPC12/RpoP